MQDVEITLTGVDGSRWYLHSEKDKRVFIEEGGLGDIFDVPATTSLKARVGAPGAMFVGSRQLERHLALPLVVHDPDPLEWQRLDSGLRRAFSFEKEATLEVTTPFSGTRSLKVRLSEQPQYRGERNPARRGVSQWTFPLVAADPFWRGQPYRAAWEFNGINWFGDYITVQNLADQPSWPKWLLTSPAKFILPDPDLEAHPLGVSAEDARMIDIPFQPLGQTATLDTDPHSEMIITDGGVPLWAQMNGQFFEHPIPPHTRDIKIPIAVDPLPNTGWLVPVGVKKLIAGHLRKVGEAQSDDYFLRLTPQGLAELIQHGLLSMSEKIMPQLTDKAWHGLTVKVIAEAITKAYGSVGNMAGATAEVMIEQRWSRPWGLE